MRSPTLTLSSFRLLELVEYWRIILRLGLDIASS